MNAFFDSGRYATRLAAPKYQDWCPEEYQVRAVSHLAGRHSGGLALDPGLGKTACTLGAFLTLLATGRARTMLVIAPLRVCRQVWRQEGQKWAQFRDLKFALIHGNKKEQLLRDGLKAGVHIYLINPEGVRWLCNLFFGRQLPFDVVCIDELTRFKNSQADRCKALRPRIDNARYRWGLTGSLAPNGYMDLFGQMLMLDSGAALGKYITHYRDRYFQCGFDGFTYDLLPGAAERITEKIAPYWLQMTAEDYITLPPLVTDKRMLELDKASRAAYTDMKKDMLAELPEGTITASNAAGVYAKLSQMANGAVYKGDGTVAHIHDIKLDALEELIEELNGQPLLVAYEFNHDLDRLRERFGKADANGKKTVAFLGNGTTPAQEDMWIAQWNRGELPLMFAHPASAGHGLNLQEGHAAHVVWFSATWDLELYDQFIRRLRRRGNEAQRIFNHLLIVENTIDELKLSALTSKDTTQRALLNALNAVIALENGGQLKQERTVVQRISRQADQNTGNGNQQAAGGVPKGWGAGGGGGAPQGQREAIREQIAPREDTRSQFTGGVQEQAGRIAQEDYGQGGATNQPKGWGAQQGGQANEPPFDPNPQTGNETAPPPSRSRSRSTANKAASGPGAECLRVRRAVGDHEGGHVVEPRRRRGRSDRDHPRIVRIRFERLIHHGAGQPAPFRFHPQEHSQHGTQDWHRAEGQAPDEERRRGSGGPRREESRPEVGQGQSRRRRGRRADGGRDATEHLHR